MVVNSTPVQTGKNEPSLLAIQTLTLWRFKRLVRPHDLDVLRPHDLLLLRKVDVVDLVSRGVEEVHLELESEEWGEGGR